MKKIPQHENPFQDPFVQAEFKGQFVQQCKASNMFFLLQARSVCNPSCCHYNPSYNVIYCFQEIKLPL